MNKQSKQDRDVKIVCSSCHTAGNVRTSKREVKRGVSGGKAVAALLTCGVSLFLVGLSRKATVMAMACSNCGVTNVANTLRWSE